jgi:hypothetical protein
VRHFARIGVFILLLSSLLSAEYFASKKAEDSTLPRNLTGTVVDQSNRAVPGAVVYLKNQRNLAIITYITGDDGSYRFNNLSPDVDYQVHAESGGRKSETRSLSSFNQQKQPRLDLKLVK